jgi:uncharacterized membrane protein
MKHLLTVFFSFLLFAVSFFSLSLPAHGQELHIEEQVFDATITKILEETAEPYDEDQVILYQQLEILFNDGTLKGERTLINVNRMISVNQDKYVVGDRILVNQSTSSDGQVLYYIIDYMRNPQILWFFTLFVVTVLIIGRSHGLRSLIGLAASFAIIFKVLLPMLQSGYDPIITAILSAFLIMIFTFYLSHGVNKKTSVAIAGTFIALIITGILATVMIDWAKLTGYAAEEVSFLQVVKQGSFNARGLLLAGIIIGALGVLDDITISQASVVKELKRANPKLSRAQIFKRSMNVGQDHIASLVNTLVLVYTGSALPLLLLFTLDANRSFQTILSYEIISEEIIRTLVGSIGLVLAVPITTYLASFVKFDYSKEEGDHHHHH